MLTPQERQQQFKMRSEMLAEIVRDPDLDLSDGVSAVRAIAPGADATAMLDVRERLEKLEADMPKIKQGFRGPEMPSSQEIRKFNAYFEATTDPLSVFDDFASGTLDYDKAQRAWEVYPGLQLAAQMAVQDILFTQMDDGQRAAMPEQLLSQLDMLLGLEGGLQPTVAPEFVKTVTMVAQTAASKQKPSAKKPLELPTSEPTPMSRIAGHRR
jgi:hypothetical protein